MILEERKNQEVEKSFGFLVSFSDRHIFVIGIPYLSLFRAVYVILCFSCAFRSFSQFGGKFFLAASQNTGCVRVGKVESIYNRWKIEV